MTTASTTPNVDGDTAWQHFWNRGGWWKAVLVAAVYVAVYQCLGLLMSALFGAVIDRENPLTTPLSTFFSLALPILIMGVLTLTLVFALGWQREIFGRQPVTGRWWMWIAVVLVLVPNVMKLVATNWSAYSVALVLSVLFLGLCVGFAEELLTRGVAVNLLRRAGYTERLVMVLSAVIFALLHSANALSGQNPIAVLFTVIYTFGFGTMMYLSMRVTGSIVWAMLLHASTDPSTFLATGAMAAHAAPAADDGLVLAASVFNYVYLLFALIAIFLVRGTVYADRSPNNRRSGL